MTNDIINFTKHARRRNVTLKHENLETLQPETVSELSTSDCISFEHDEDTVTIVENWDEDTIELTISDTKSGEDYDGYRIPAHVFSIIGSAYMNMTDGYINETGEE